MIVSNKIKFIKKNFPNMPEKEVEKTLSEKHMKTTKELNGKRQIIRVK
jgi:hypothetical protein